MATKTQTASSNANAKPLNNTLSDTTFNGTLSPSMRCPDPSVHQTKNTALQEQASAAALHSTNSSKNTNIRQVDVGTNPLGPDGKLSSASAATSIKHARAHELPSFPVVGIDAQLSAGTAANLAHTSTKSREYWKPEGTSAAAGKAALLANDYKMAPLWQPEASAAGSKAALLAHRDGVKLNLWMPETSAHGNSAATIAMRDQGPSPAVDYGYTEDGRKRALVAATGAISSSRRPRAQSTPVPPPIYPDSENSARNALNAATIAHTPSMIAKTAPAAPAVTDSNRLGSGAMEAARIQHSKSISRNMYTEHPPIALEVEERKRQDALRASAVSMAKQMYDVQQHHSDRAGEISRAHAQTGAAAAHEQRPSTSEAALKQQAMRYIGIQEAAQKLAAERLAKIGFDENAAYRSYYGYEKPSRAKLSVRLGRNRASSNPETVDSDDDELQSRRIRSQMSQFNKSLAEIDAKKREEDRKHLLAAAERKVQAQMQGLDKKIYDETGKMSPAMVEEWDARARAKAAADSEARMENHGKVHIGHGKFMNQADIDAVAQARIQPTLDEITKKTEKRRAEEEEKRLELEEQRREAQRDKERAAEIKAEEKRHKDEEKKATKARAAEEKAAVKQEKEAEKEKKAEEKRLQKEEKRKSKDAAKISALDTTPRAPDAAPGASPTANEEVDERDDDLYRDPTPRAHTPHARGAETSTSASPTSPTSPTSPKGIKNFLNKFKRRSKHSAASAEIDKPGFIGGASLRHASSHSHRDSAPSSPHAQAVTEATPGSRARRYSDVSSLSSAPAADDNERGRGIGRTVTGSSVSDGNEFEEARDEFDEKLAPPPSFTSTCAGGRNDSPGRSSKFHEVGI